MADLNLLDNVKRTDPNGAIANIVEAISQENTVIYDAVAKEGNLPTGHRFTARETDPAIGWRLYNDGITPGKSTTEQYDETIRRLEKSGDWLPEGLEFHVAFEAGGKLRVSEIWDSQAQFDAFGKRLMPILEDVRIDPGAPEMLEIHNIIRR